jgi:hypothetical protein
MSLSSSGNVFELAALLTILSFLIENIFLLVGCCTVKYFTFSSVLKKQISYRKPLSTNYLFISEHIYCLLSLVSLLTLLQSLQNMSHCDTVNYSILAQGAFSFYMAAMLLIPFTKDGDHTESYPLFVREHVSS